ncbi:hypothetical protein FN846DRAFT_1023317 [Sphaerosporella brunnea]|uniref:Uncharacterized protein n=1 Tax=Sphaerosporella brunnea TaxID=1250544 RepID=A0A5J5EPF1_9PEZI|nr:hypothetical protein FN846DRAFT_1023317 [Sphaerosporella brunnea]
MQIKRNENKMPRKTPVCNEPPSRVNTKHVPVKIVHVCSSEVVGSRMVVVRLIAGFRPPHPLVIRLILVLAGFVGGIHGGIQILGGLILVILVVASTSLISPTSPCQPPETLQQLPRNPAEPLLQFIHPVSLLDLEARSAVSPPSQFSPPSVPSQKPIEFPAAGVTLVRRVGRVACCGGGLFLPDMGGVTAPLPRRISWTNLSFRRPLKPSGLGRKIPASSTLSSRSFNSTIGGEPFSLGSLRSASAGGRISMLRSVLSFTTGSSSRSWGVLVRERSLGGVVFGMRPFGSGGKTLIVEEAFEGFRGSLFWADRAEEVRELVVDDIHYQLANLFGPISPEEAPSETLKRLFNDQRLSATPKGDLSLTKTPSPPRQRYSPLIPPEEVPQPGDPNYEPPGPLARTHDRDEDPVVKLNTERNIEILPPADADLSEPKLKGSPPRSAVAFAPIVELKDLDDSVEEAGILRPRPEGFRGRLKERLVQEIRRGRGAVTPPISGRNSPPPQHATLPTRRTRVTPAAGNSMGFWEGYRRWRELRRWRNRGPGLKVEERNRMDELEEWFSGISGKLLERFRRLARRRRRDQGSGSNDQDDEDETSEDLDTTVDATDETSEDEDQTDNQRMRRTKTSNQADDDHSGTHNL